MLVVVNLGLRPGVTQQLKIHTYGDANSPAGHRGIPRIDKHHMITAGEIRWHILVLRITVR